MGARGDGSRLDALRRYKWAEATRGWTALRNEGTSCSDAPRPAALVAEPCSQPFSECRNSAPVA